ncbi:aspartate phosphatase [Bacillus velezensis]|nr:aspartate phosphatase [Bacillus velezensis]
MLECCLRKFRIFVERGVYRMSKLASERVANILNDWYIAIKQQDAESAEKYFEEIKPLLDEMEEDQEVLMYYSLLEERHKMLL